MALHLVFRPHAGTDEPINRPDTASIRKMLAEGGLKELIIFLGWQIDTRRLTMALPEDKFVSWSAQITNLIDSKSATQQALATLIGRLEHVCFIIPDARHFMSRLRGFELMARHHRNVRLSAKIVADLKLWSEFLLSAPHEGISLNSIVFWKPTLVSFTDASEEGMGGYCPTTGIAWRYKFSEREQRVFTLNCKEYLAVVVDLKIQLKFDSYPGQCPCYLSWCDNTTGVSWLRKSSHKESQPIHMAIARDHARAMMELNACN